MLGDQADNVRGKLSVNNLLSRRPAITGAIHEITRQSLLVGWVRQLSIFRERS